ncbi:hypothetical protein Tco_1021839, partial [Tanacetum coccineum]
ISGLPTALADEQARYSPSAIDYTELREGDQPPLQDNANVILFVNNNQWINAS